MDPVARADPQAPSSPTARAAAREVALARAAAGLLGAEDAADVASTVRGALTALAAAHPHADVGLAVGNELGGALVIVADHDGSVRERTVFVPELPGSVRAALAERRTFTVADNATALRTALGFGGRPGPVVVMPLEVHGRIQGAATFRCPAPATERCDCSAGLETLGAQMALALRNVTLRAELRRSEARFRALVQHATDLITVVSSERVVTYQSPSARQILGVDPQAVTGTRIDRWVHGHDRGTVQRMLQRAAAGPVRTPVEVRLRHADGSWRHMEVTANGLLDEPGVRGIVLHAHDVSERRMLQEQLRHRAFHDPLTGLANRALLTDRLNQALARRRRAGRPALLFIDLDDFKAVNDSFGHALGDQLLRAAAGRVKASIRPSDTAARLGGDEFAVLLDAVGDTAGAVAVADRVLAALRDPFELAGRVLRVRASIGVALAGGGDRDADELMRRADDGMYLAKAAGRDRVGVARPERDATAG